MLPATARCSLCLSREKRFIFKYQIEIYLYIDLRMLIMKGT